MHTLGEIAALLNCPPLSAADAAKGIRGVSSLEEAGEQDIALVATDNYAKLLDKSRAGAVMVGRRVKLPAEPNRPVLRVDDAELAMARVLELFAPPVPQPPAGVDAGARVAATATLGTDVAIGPFAAIGERSRIGDRTIIHPGVVIGDDVTVGDDCQIFPNVVIRERITIGSRVTIHAGSVLGTDGFGYRWDGAKHQKVPQIGTVVIEDDVEIGSCVCIDRAKFSVTRIGKGTKIDNLVQIGHNVHVGPHCIIVGQVGLAGSCKLGAGVVLGGQTAVRDHITIGDAAMAAARSAIAEDVEPKQVVSGMPALPHRQTLREQGALRRLPELVVQVRKLQEEIEAIKKSMG